MTEDPKQKSAPGEVDGTDNEEQMTENENRSGGDEPSIEQQEYPLRQPAEDPRWAVRIVWTWVSIALFLLLFLFTLIILGIWYD